MRLGRGRGAGYGRIDVRVDERGTPFVTDVNPNPDLSPRVGLSSQAAAAGWTYVDLIARIVADALTRGASLPEARRREATRATARGHHG